ncbi:MAG: hypothetical protein R3A80_09320 [Bdellovibrionota bacterium]
MKKNLLKNIFYKSSALFLFLSFHSIESQPIKVDDTKAVTAYIALDPSERSKENPHRELITEFDPSVFPIDVILKFNYSGEATEAQVIVSGAIQSTIPGKLGTKWVAAKKLSKIYNVNLSKGENSLMLIDLQVSKAAEDFIDDRKQKGTGKGIGLSFEILVKNSSVGVIKKTFPAHIANN